MLLLLSWLTAESKLVGCSGVAGLEESLLSPAGPPVPVLAGEGVACPEEEGPGEEMVRPETL